MIRLDRPLATRLREPAPPPAAVEATWARIQARRAAPVWRRRNSFTWLAPALAAVALALFGAYLLHDALGSAPQPFALADGGPMGVVEATTEARAITFTDGSQITLSPGTQLSAEHVEGAVFRSELGRGRARFDVVPHGPRRWLIQAGDVRVSVLGTRFVVVRDAGVVEVEVERGLVELTGPGVPAGRVQLGAAQRLRVLTRPQPAAAAPVTEPAPPPPAAAFADAPVPPPSAANDSAPPPAAAKPAAKRRREDELTALLARADEARLSGRPVAAAEAFERAVRGYPKDPRAALAAFTLGRLYLDQLVQPARAAEAFERACALGLPSALAEEGAARVVEALTRAGLHARARRAAAAYVAHFPEGANRAAVEGWMRTL